MTGMVAARSTRLTVLRRARWIAARRHWPRTATAVMFRGARSASFEEGGSANILAHRAPACALDMQCPRLSDGLSGSLSSPARYSAGDSASSGNLPRWLFRCSHSASSLTTTNRVRCPLGTPSLRCRSGFRGPTLISAGRRPERLATRVRLLDVCRARLHRRQAMHSGPRDPPGRRPAVAASDPARGALLLPGGFRRRTPVDAVRGADGQPGPGLRARFRHADRASASARCGLG